MQEWLKTNYEASQISDREFNHSTEEKQRGERSKGRYMVTTEHSDDSDDQDDRQSELDDEEETITFNPKDKTFWVNPKTGGQPYKWNGKSSFPKKKVHFDDKTRRYGDKPIREPLKLKPTDVCVLSKTSHEMSNCQKFKNLSLKEKKLIVRSSVLCFHCLSTKHLLKDCKVNKGKLCGTEGCKFYHHPLIHAEKLQINVEYDNDCNWQLTTELKNQFSKTSRRSKKTLLFGCNVTRLFNSTKTTFDGTNPNSPVVIQTLLGWTCVGNSANQDKLKKDPTLELVNVFFKIREKN